MLGIFQVLLVDKLMTNNWQITEQSRIIIFVGLLHYETLQLVTKVAVLA